VAVPTPSNGGSGAETASLTRLDAIPASVVLAAAIPFLFFHIDFQPGFTVEFGSLSAHAVLSDFAVLAVAVVALVAGVRHGFEPLRAGWRSTVWTDRRCEFPTPMRTDWLLAERTAAAGKAGIPSCGSRP
jgi:hypothetical protein